MVTLALPTSSRGLSPTTPLMVSIVVEICPSMLCVTSVGSAASQLGPVDVSEDRGAPRTCARAGHIRDENLVRPVTGKRDHRRRTLEPFQHPFLEVLPRLRHRDVAAAERVVIGGLLDEAFISCRGLRDLEHAVLSAPGIDRASMRRWRCPCRRLQIRTSPASGIPVLWLAPCQREHQTSPCEPGPRTCSRSRLFSAILKHRHGTSVFSPPNPLTRPHP